MRRRTLIFGLFIVPALTFGQSAIMSIDPHSCVWHEGDDMRWAAPALDETGWQPYTQWQPNPDRPRIWVRCHADLSSLRSVTQPALQVTLYAAYQIYLNGALLGAAGDLRTGNFSVDAVRTFPAVASRFTPGPATVALRITRHSKVSGPNPIIPRLDEKVTVNAGDKPILDALRARLILQGTSQYAVPAICYMVIAVVAIMLLGLFFYDRSRRDLLLLSIACLVVAAVRLNEFCSVALMNYPFTACLLIIWAANLALVITEYPFFFALARRRVPLLWKILMLAGFLGLLPRALEILPARPAWMQPLYIAYLPVFLLVVLSSAPFAAFWPWSRISRRMRPLAALCMLWGAADLVWFALQTTAIPLPGVPNVFARWGVTLLYTRAFFTAGVLTALLALLFREQRQVADERAEMAGEMQAARRVQQYLIPEQLPATPGFTVESDYRPAREVGGDFFQVLPHTADGSLLIVVGDVAGKGMEAGMLAALIVGAVRTAAAFTSDTGRILALLNERLRGRGLVTCLALRIEHNGAATLSNAGHLPPYLNGKELMIEGSLPLGAAAGIEFPILHLQLAAGDQLMLMTDGIVEAQDAQGDLFGFDRIADMLHRGMAAAELATAAQSFGQEDDITVLTVERMATGTAG